MINDFLNILLPQTCLILFIIIELLFAIFANNKNEGLARILSITGLSFTIALLSTVQIEPQYFGMRNALMSDSYTLLFHFIILLCGFFVVLLTRNLTNSIKNNAFTLQALILTAILGAMNVICSNDFLTLFISLELLSFPTYFLIASANGYRPKEASFKYLITSAISTGVYLFGVSYLYGLTSTLNISEIYEIIITKETSLIQIFSMLMIIFGLISKLALFPFANWIIDIYKGTETSILAFLSTIPKLALFGILCRLIVFPLSGSFEITTVIILISLITGFWANIYALKEHNIKAILACSSSANASYIMLTASLVSVYNLSTVIFYLLCYVILNITVFAVLNIIETNKIGLFIDDFKGLFKTDKITSIAYVIAILGLAGFPVTSGFVAKIYLFSAIAHSGLIFIPVLFLLLILTVIALYYYLKLIFPIFEDFNNKETLEIGFSQKIVIIVTTIITILVGIYPEKLIELCRYIAYNI